MSPIISVKDLTISVDQNTIIDQLSFDIDAEDFVSIQGPSGSGKSTILKYLSQLLSTNLEASGQYLLEGKDVMDWNPMKLRQTVSYCFQNPVLFGDTVRDNFEFVYQIHNQSFDQARCQSLLQAMKLSPDYLDHSINDLSGGERHRVALVRNLLFPPKVLLLDEVTSALDENTRKIIWEFLFDLKDQEDMTFIMVSHSPEEQAMAKNKIQLKAKAHKDSENNEEGGVTTDEQ